ncbi:hypothetical protein AALO_G00073160 [Alosa alosa]|uniref:Uncharacterized protein n=1 Tax=Alosa alosa TaxID=278164 RepID=A0AAV6H3A7_9TELE|nr:uncharacterized protein LOC125294302 [Alosa alosa]KAG5281519.1 hypothetical protein AALO_G00073160 [Alosa alosa]
MDTKMDEMTLHTDKPTSQQACIELEKATQFITQVLQHEVGRNRELCMVIRRLEEREAETRDNWTEQVESNRLLKLKIDELQKHLVEKDNLLSKANQTVTFLWKELGEAHQLRMKSLGSSLQLDQLRSTVASLVRSELLVSMHTHGPLLSPHSQLSLVSSDAQSPSFLYAQHGPPVLSNAEGPPVLSHAQSPPVLSHAQSPPILSHVQTLQVFSDSQRPVEAPVCEIKAEPDVENGGDGDHSQSGQQRKDEESNSDGELRPEMDHLSHP